MPWFWEGTLQGGGVLNDMNVHSVEEARFMLTPPGAPREILTPVSVTAYTNCLKWQGPSMPDHWPCGAAGTDRTPSTAGRGLRPLPHRILSQREGKIVGGIFETTTSWCYVGAGLR